MTPSDRIRPRERDAIIQSLRAGVTPFMGLQHIQVGRKQEIEALIRDLDRIVDAGASFRLVIGEYGAGKTFFLHLVRSIALQKRLVTMHADLSPDRRLQSTGGQAQSLYAELARNMATRSRPDGGALAGLAEKFISNACDTAKRENAKTDDTVAKLLSPLRDMVGGYDYAVVLSAYWRGHQNGDESLKSSAIRWLRGEFSTRTEARAALGVRTIVDDSSAYDHLKLLARFVRIAGYGGLLVCLDEMVNLYKIANTLSRNANYEQLLRIVNDTLQGSVEGLGVLMGGTPEFLFDSRRGLFSYPALQSRLAGNTFAAEGRTDYTGPVLRLDALTQEDYYVLLANIRHVYASGDLTAYLVPDEALKAFMSHCQVTLGEAYFRTPRTTIKTFIDLLATLEQNPGAKWQNLLSRAVPEKDAAPDNLHQDAVDGDVNGQEDGESPSGPTLIKL